MKAKIRVATDMYEFIELDVDMPVDELWSAYKELKGYTVPTQGFTEKEFNHLVDEYLNTGTLLNGTELYEKMSEKQKWFFQVLKRHSKRNGYHDKTN